jgi:proline racemase
MCGHGTIGVATALVEKKLVKVVEPVTTIRLDTPAGLVVVDVAVEDGRAKNVTLTNVPSFSYALDQVVDVPGLGKITYDMAYGGNFYAIVPVERVGIEFKRENGQKFLDAGLKISDAINEQNRPVHPENPDIAVCHHIDFISPGEEGALHWKNAMAIHPGWFDRSPCGTGTSARLAQMVARGEFKDGDVLNNESPMIPRPSAMPGIARISRKPSPPSAPVNSPPSTAPKAVRPWNSSSPCISPPKAAGRRSAYPWRRTPRLRSSE